jgi:hypothetical protein
MKGVILFIISISFFCCKTSRNGYSKMPQEKYNFEYMSNLTSKATQSNDTIVFLTLGGGYMRGVEHYHYSVKKINEKTFVQRISNFQKFRLIEIPSSTFPWTYITDNINRFVSDTIKNEKKIITEDGKILQQQIASHGPTTSLRIKLGKTEHKIYLAPLVNSCNNGNINLELIDKTKRSILTLDYKPSEQIKYKWER